MPQIVHIHDYATCVRKATNPPIRGRSKPQWWVDRNNREQNYYMHIAPSLVPPVAGPSYALRMYHTDLVTYHADGSVTLKTYNSATTRDVASAWAPRSTEVVGHRGRMYWKVYRSPGRAEYYTDTLTVVPAAQPGFWDVATEQRDNGTRFVLNKQRGAAARKLPPVALANTMIGVYAALTDAETRAPSDREPFRPFAEVLAQALHGFYRGDPWEQQLQKHLSFELERDFPRGSRYAIPTNDVTDTAYLLLGAYDEVVVPLDELPRKSTRRSHDKVWVSKWRKAIREAQARVRSPA